MLARVGGSTTRYDHRLATLLDDQAAMAHDPMTVGRLQRLRAARRRQRSASRAV